MLMASESASPRASPNGGAAPLPAPMIPGGHRGRGTALGHGPARVSSRPPQAFVSRALKEWSMPELQPGDPRRLGSYEIVERLGEGGQGVVYAGVDASGNRAAIKLLRADLSADAGARNRFVREAQAAKQVARFCTAQVLEA